MNRSLAAKRTFDAGCSALGLLFFAPLLVLIAVANWAGKISGLRSKELPRAKVVTGKRRASICLLSAAHPPQDKRVFQKEAISLVRAGFRVTHLCPASEPGSQVVQGVELITYPNHRTKFERLLMLPALFWKARALDTDAYHCNEPDSWLIGVLLRLLSNKIVIFDCHEHYPGQVVRWLPRPLRSIGAWCVKYYLQLLGLLTHRIVLAKPSLADDFSWSRRRQLVVLNTTPLETTQAARGPRCERERAGRSPEFTFVHIGVIRRERGSEQLLEAMRLLVDRDASPFRVVIIGEFKDGSEADFFDKAAANGLRERIEFHRWLPFAEAFSLVRESHAGLILFQKSLANNVRGMPHKMFDYMSAGLPVIAPDFAPDIAGVLNEADAGVLIDTDDAVKLADAMQVLLDDRSMADELGENGRRAVVAKYHWERDAETLIADYRGLLGIRALKPTDPARQEAA